MDKFISGRQIEVARKQAGLAQKDLYKAVDVSRATYHNWVVGKSEPSANQFLAMLKICWQKSQPKEGLTTFDELIQRLVNIGSSEADNQAA
ncbi:helix-turn-helix transcriptional regulator [Gayadomonas joobiniege]|uniref:helix-turn-helix transcriptional regulator n=1 Tax=Gayadomonas joobiniege TaxID=1234606 RepID=UPI00036F8023|nr:helix-turn-helix transcriptional regulator [Gayadomonas joobiniege]